MRKTFDYWFEFTANGFIDIEDTGNVCLRAQGPVSLFEDGLYFLVIRTNDVGITKVLTYGPLHVFDEDDSPINQCSCSYRRLEYDTYKINSIIKDFIRTTRATSIEEVEFEDIKDKLKNIVDLIV